MENNKYFDALGVEPLAPEQEPEVNPAPAVPAGEQPTEPTTPSQPEADGAAVEENAGKGSEDKAPLSMEQRRENAARRRAQETQAAVDKALQAQQQKNDALLKEVFEKAGLKNPFTGQPITNHEELRQWNEEQSRRQVQKDLKDGKLTPEAISQAVGNHPAIRQAESIVQQHEAQQQAIRDQQYRAQAEAEFARIQQLDPSIKEPKDILALPTADSFNAYLDRGYSMEDAFYLANRERLEQQKADAAAQAVLNNARSKDHLSPVGNSRASNDVEVPANVMRYYRRLMPNASADEIRRHYNANKK